MEPTQGFLARKQEYFDYCFENNGPGKGGLYGQVCRVAGGAGELNEESIEAACAKVDAREDTADFRVAGLVRLLYLDQIHQVLSPETRTRVEDTLLNFRFWFTEPGDDKMCYWTENHQVLFHSGELLAGQLFPDHTFANSGMTGAEHILHAAPLLERWLDFRGRFGFSEWHSNVYFNEDLPALFNLVDFAENETIRTKAAMVLDLMAYDMLNNYYRGHFATTHGRTYPSKFLDGLNDSTREAAWIMLGLGGYASPGNFSASFLATSSNYWPPPLLEEIAQATLENHEHRQRDSINVADGPTFGIGYESLEDVVFWAGLSALVAPQVVNGTVKMLDDYGLWNGFLFGDIPEPFDSMLKKMAGTPELEQLATELEVVSRGIALESIDTYTWRTPHYQLSGAQDYKPGMWMAQTQIWQATLDREAFVFTSFPGNMEEMDTGLEFGGKWIGGWNPRATFHRHLGVIRYRKSEVSMLDEYLSADHTHAFFPRDRFDQVREEGSWVCGRKGDGYVALYSHNPTHWAEEEPHELVAPGTDNVWLVELGSAEESGEFDEFVEKTTAAQVEVGDKVSWDSPSAGLVEVGMEGPMTVDGVDIDLGPYPRWDNGFGTQQFGSLVTTIDFQDHALNLDFEQGTRLLLAR